jgi:hypothetical protein
VSGQPLDAETAVHGLLADVAEARAQLADVTAERDKAYRERAHLVAYLAACHPSVMLTDSAEPDWPIVFAMTPAGQMSWHIAKADLELFGHVPATTNPTWDGHTTDEKYARLAELTRTVAGNLRDPLRVEAAAAHGRIGALTALVRDILQSLPDTADEQEWRDLAGAAGVTDPDGTPYRAWTEDDL